MFHGSDLATLITNTQIVVRVTSITGAALEDIRLTHHTLFMTVNRNCVQLRLASRASLFMRIGRVQGVVQSVKLQTLHRYISRVILTVCNNTDSFDLALVELGFHER
jgi:hypothetical protein